MANRHIIIISNFGCVYEHGWSGLHRSGPDLFERRRSNGPSGPYTTLRGEEIIYSRAVERKDYCGMASEPDLPKIADGGADRAATISTVHPSATGQRTTY